MKAVCARDALPLLLAAAFGAIPLVHEGGPLAALPLLFLILPLVFGRYPGEATLQNLRRRTRRPARPARAIVAKPDAPRRQALLRSRLLIAASLAERAPPLPATG